MHYNFACLSSKLCCCFFFFNIWVQETMWRKIEGNPASELPWEQSSWSLKTRSAACVCVCVWGQWHASFCVLVWILFCCFSAVFAKSVCLYQHVFVRCHKLVSHCKNFQLPSAYFFFFQLQLDRFTWESIGLKVVYTWPQCNHFFLSML